MKHIWITGMEFDSLPIFFESGSAIIQGLIMELCTYIVPMTYSFDPVGRPFDINFTKTA